MTSPIEQLQSAGFSDDEIGAWSKDQRATLGAAGFADNEIDDYLGGPKKPIPPSFIERVRRGSDATSLANIVRYMPEFSRGIAEGIGLPGESLKEQLPSMSGPEQAGAVIGRIPGGLVDAIRGAGQTTEAAMTGQPVGAEEAFNAALFGAHMRFSRMGHASTGEVQEQQIGGLPASRDFADAARAVAGTPAPVEAIRAKIEALWQDHGVHPGEVAHDAELDPTIAQDLASSGRELPGAYVPPGRQPTAGPAGEAVETAPPVAPMPAPETGTPAQQPAEANGGPQIRSFAPVDLRLDPARFQFKAAGDSEGVSERLQGVERWDPIKAGLGIVYEDANGASWIVDGHQRLALAKRIETADPSQAPRLNALVLRAADGITDSDARIAAAGKNIAEGTGSAVDAAKVLRESPASIASLPPRSELVRQAQGLANLDNEAFGKVINGVVPANHAAIVGRLAPDDPAMQNGLIDLLAKTVPDNVVQAESIVRQGLDAGLHRGTQTTLFGDEEIVSSLYGERARILDRALRTLRRDRVVFQSITDNHAIIEELGNQLAQDENARRSVTDGHAVQVLQTLANRRGGIGDSLTAAARSVADGTADAAAATRSFVAEIRRQAESGTLLRESAGGSAGPVAAPGPGRTGAGATAGTAAAPAEHGIRDVSPAEEALAEIRVGQAIAPAAEPAVTGGASATKSASPDFALTAPEAPAPREVLPPDLERTAQGVQRVLPGAERSAVQAAAAREAEGNAGRAAQQEPGGLFAPKEEAPQPGLFGGLMRDESGALSLGTGAAPPAAPPIEAAYKTIGDKISVGDPGPSRKWTWERLYTNIFDRFRPVSEAVSEGERAAGEALATEENPYRLYRMMASSPGKADHFLNTGTLDFASGKINGKSLQAALAPVMGDLDRFRAFATSLHAIELNQAGITSGFDLPAAWKVVGDGLDRGFAAPMAEYVAYNNRVAAYLRDAGVLSHAGYDAMTAKWQLYVPFNRVMDAVNTPRGRGAGQQPQNPVKRILGSERDIIDPIENTVRNTYAFMQMADANRAGTALVDFLVREGAAEQRPAARPAGRTTSPAESFDGQTILDVDGTPLPPTAPEQLPLRARVAPDAETRAPEAESVGVEHDVETEDAVRDYLRQHGIENPDELVSTMTAGKAPRDDEIRIFRDGTPSAWRVDPEIARAVKSLDPAMIGIWEKLGSPFTRTLSAGAVLTPEFWARHVLRDYQYSVVTDQGFYSPLNMYRGLVSAFWKDDNFRRWEANGGANISFVSTDRRYLQRQIEKFTDTGLFERSWNVIGDPENGVAKRAAELGLLPFRAADKLVLEPLRAVTEIAETASHLGKFIKETRRMEGSLAPGEELTRGQIEEAAWQSRALAVDAARRGASTRALNSTSAFFNIKLQDTDRVVRAFIDQPKTTALRIGLGIMLPTAILWYVNRQDPDYKELHQADKDLFWHLPIGSTTPTPVAQAAGKVSSPLFYFRLPKAWGMGLIFGSAFERALDAFVDHDPDAFRRFGQSIAEVSIPAPVPDALKAPFEQFANRSTFTNRTLIPAPLEKGLPEYQYLPYTTELSQRLGSMISAFPGMRAAATDQSGIFGNTMGGVARALTSPILLENYVRSWTGTLGMHALHLADAALRKSGVLPDPPQPADRLSDIPVIGAFIARYPSATAESIERFYEEYDTNKRYFTSWEAKAKEGDAAALDHILMAGGSRLFVQLDGIRQTLSDNSQLVRDIWKNPEMPPEEKRQLIDQIYFNMVLVARDGREAMGAVDKALAAPH